MDNTAALLAEATTTSRSPIELSIIVPVYNEEECIPELVQKIESSIEEKSFEIILVDDGSSDRSEDAISEASSRSTHVRGVLLSKNYGQTQALARGFEASRGEIVVFIDADLQNDPEDIPLLVDHIHAGADVVSGWRKDRRDSFLDRRLPSLIANRIISFTTNVKLHDFGCTLKAYRREVLENIDFYDDMHRIIPLYAHEQGFNVEEVVVRHHARRHGRSKYGLGRALNVVLDVLFFQFFSRFLRQPIHFFGRVSLLSLLFGLLVAIAVVIRRLFFGGMWISPGIFVSMIAVLMGIQFFLIGILGEILVRIYFDKSTRSTSRVRGTIEHKSSDIL